MKPDTEDDLAAPDDDWLPGLYAQAGLSGESPLALVEERMDELAKRAAPEARTGWKWLILTQGMSVAAPLLWLVRRPLGLTPAAAAWGTLIAGTVLVAALWWVRWRGMQRTWARARLVAEVARSRLAAAVCPSPLPLHALEAIEVMRGLPAAPPSAIPAVWPQWKDDWIAGRVAGQLQYFRDKKAIAEKSREQITRWTTHFMDAMLALAAAGIVVTLSHRAPQWLRALGDYRIEFALGVAGALLPLGIILLQSLRHLQELNRRTAGFANQMAMLEKARRELGQAATPEAALRIVTSTEDKLLAEVVDWYYQTETAEQFFQVRLSPSRVKPSRSGAPFAPSPRWRPLGRALALGGASFLFLCQVILGRTPWVAGASALTLAWLSFATPSDPEARMRLRADAALVDEAGRPWQPSAERAAAGCIIIAHGLHDGVMLAPSAGETAWMQDMSQALQHRLHEPIPNIGLVDWTTAANPTDITKIDPRVSAAKFIADVAGIQPQAREVGDLLAFRLAQWILENKIRRDQPLQLIGHSAGGFVVARAALVLKEMNLAPSRMQVTILDTPAPDDELLVKLPKLCHVDFYVTSGFVLGLKENDAASALRIRRIPCDPSFTLLQAHSFAHTWFTKTIPAAVRDDIGFGRSPFCPAGK